MEMENITRRQLVSGAVWSAPAILATTAVPAYASSACPEIAVTGGDQTTSTGDHLVFITSERPLPPGTYAHLTEGTLQGADPTTGQVDLTGLTRATLIITPSSTGGWYGTIHTPGACEPAYFDSLCGEALS